MYLTPTVGVSMGKRIEYKAGDRFSGTRLSFIEDISSPSQARWAKFKCECGNVIEVQISWVRSLNTMSCGCLRREETTLKNTKHGCATRNKQSGAYRSWQAMHQRCKSNPYYKNISICDRWSVFENFLKDMGERPDRRSIERLDNSKGYEPDNCVWATYTEQANNNSNAVMVSINGVTNTINEWCRIQKISYRTVKDRRAKGMSLKDAIMTPVKKPTKK